MKSIWLINSSFITTIISKTLAILKKVMEHVDYHELGDVIIVLQHRLRVDSNHERRINTFSSTL